MGSLARFWRRLEIEPDLRATDKEWRLMLDDDYGAFTSLLEQTGELASFVPSPSRNAPELRVAEHIDGALVAVCDCELTETLELEPDDVVLHRVSVRELRKTLAFALGIRTSRTTADAFPGVLTLGHWEPQPETSFPVALAAHPDVGALHMLVREYVLGCRKPAIVLTPTDDGWSDELIEWVREHRCLLAVADDLLSIEEGSWRATDLWSERLAAFEAITGFKRQTGTQNKRPRKKRESRTAKIEAIKETIIEELKSQIKAHRAATELGRQYQWVCVTQAAIAKRADCSASDFSRCKGDDPSIASYFELVNDPERAMKWWANYRANGASCS